MSEEPRTEWAKGDQAVWRDIRGVDWDVMVTAVEGERVQVRVPDLAFVWVSHGELSQARRAA